MCILHVCGGDPKVWFKNLNIGEYSPRMWRWSSAKSIVISFSIVFSTYVEVIPPTVHAFHKCQRILHVCGGDPRRKRIYRATSMYSPRMWRWSCKKARCWELWKVFSTYVEVILICLIWVLSLSRILHVCGGDPKTISYFLFGILYSPRMWRWSSSTCVWILPKVVFSTYVEVILAWNLSCAMHLRILHVCGGDPCWSVPCWTVTEYSPRMWRWSHLFWEVVCCLSVFSTYVEVILFG